MIPNGFDGGIRYSVLCFITLKSVNITRAYLESKQMRSDCLVFLDNDFAHVEKCSINYNYSILNNSSM